MKLDFKINRKILVRIGWLLLLLAILPFSFELIFLIDIGGIDFALTFLILYLGTFFNTLVEKSDNFKREVSRSVYFLAQLYMFRPRIFLSHATASGLVLAVTCSVFLACLLWIPAIYLSSSLIL